MIKEEMKQKLTNVNSMILIIQNDLMNVEGSSTDETIYNALEMLKEYIDTISFNIDKVSI